VAVLVDDGTVVVVLVEDEPTELAGLVVLVDGELAELLLGLVVVGDEDPVDADVPPDDVPAPAMLAEEPFDAVVPAEIPSVRGADLVWNARTPARPAMVATATMGARFIGFVVLS